jgi:hypothetical protein
VSRTCTICGHEQRHDIEVAVIRRDSYRAIARRFSVSKDALGRHAREHLPEALVRAQEAEPSPGPRRGPSCCARNAQYAGALLYPRTDGGCCR